MKLLVKFSKMILLKSSGTGRERMRETSMLGLPVPAKPKSMKPMTWS